MLPASNDANVSAPITNIAQISTIYPPTINSSIPTHIDSKHEHILYQLQQIINELLNITIVTTPTVVITLINHTIHTLQVILSQYFLQYSTFTSKPPCSDYIVSLISTKCVEIYLLILQHPHMTKLLPIINIFIPHITNHKMIYRQLQYSELSKTVYLPQTYCFLSNHIDPSIINVEKLPQLQHSLSVCSLDVLYHQQRQQLQMQQQHQMSLNQMYLTSSSNLDQCASNISSLAPEDSDIGPIFNTNMTTHSDEDAFVTVRYKQPKYNNLYDVLTITYLVLYKMFISYSILAGTPNPTIPFTLNDIILFYITLTQKVNGIVLNYSRYYYNFNISSRDTSIGNIPQTIINYQEQTTHTLKHYYKGQMAMRLIVMQYSTFTNHFLKNVTLASAGHTPLGPPLACNNALNTVITIMMSALFSYLTYHDYLYIFHILSTKNSSFFKYLTSLSLQKPQFLYLNLASVLAEGDTGGEGNTEPVGSTPGGPGMIAHSSTTLGNPPASSVPSGNQGANAAIAPSNTGSTGQDTDDEHEILLTMSPVLLLWYHFQQYIVKTSTSTVVNYHLSILNCIERYSAHPQHHKQFITINYNGDKQVFTPLISTPTSYYTEQNSLSYYTTLLCNNFVLSPHTTVVKKPPVNYIQYVQYDAVIHNYILTIKNYVLNINNNIANIMSSGSNPNYFGADLALYVSYLLHIAVLILPNTQYTTILPLKQYQQQRIAGIITIPSSHPTVPTDEAGKDTTKTKGNSTVQNNPDLMHNDPGNVKMRQMSYYMEITAIQNNLCSYLQIFFLLLSKVNPSLSIMKSLLEQLDLDNVYQIFDPIVVLFQSQALHSNNSIVYSTVGSTKGKTIPGIVSMQLSSAQSDLNTHLSAIPSPGTQQQVQVFQQPFYIKNINIKQLVTMLFRKTTPSGFIFTSFYAHLLSLLRLNYISPVYINKMLNNTTFNAILKSSQQQQAQAAAGNNPSNHFNLYNNNIILYDLNYGYNVFMDNYNNTNFFYYASNNTHIQINRNNSLRSIHSLPLQTPPSQMDSTNVSKLLTPHGNTLLSHFNTQNIHSDKLDGSPPPPSISGDISGLNNPLPPSGGIDNKVGTFDRSTSSFTSKITTVNNQNNTATVDLLNTNNNVTYLIIIEIIKYWSIFQLHNSITPTTNYNTNPPNPASQASLPQFVSGGAVVTKRNSVPFMYGSAAKGGTTAPAHPSNNVIESSLIAHNYNFSTKLVLTTLSSSPSSVVIPFIYSTFIQMIYNGRININNVISLISPLQTTEQAPTNNAPTASANAEQKKLSLFHKSSVLNAPSDSNAGAAATPTTSSGGDVQLSTPFTLLFSQYPNVLMYSLHVIIATCPFDRLFTLIQFLAYYYTYTYNSAIDDYFKLPLTRRTICGDGTNIQPDADLNNTSTNNMTQQSIKLEQFLLSKYQRNYGKHHFVKKSLFIYFLLTTFPTILHMYTPKSASEKTSIGFTDISTRDDEIYGMSQSTPAAKMKKYEKNSIFIILFQLLYYYPYLNSVYTKQEENLQLFFEMNDLINILQYVIIHINPNKQSSDDVSFVGQGKSSGQPTSDSAFNNPNTPSNALLLNNLYYNIIYILEFFYYSSKISRNYINIIVQNQFNSINNQNFVLELNYDHTLSHSMKRSVITPQQSTKSNQRSIGTKSPPNQPSGNNGSAGIVINKNSSNTLLSFFSSIIPSQTTSFNTLLNKLTLSPYEALLSEHNHAHNEANNNDVDTLSNVPTPIRKNDHREDGVEMLYDYNMIIKRLSTEIYASNLFFVFMYYNYSNCRYANDLFLLLLNIYYGDAIMSAQTANKTKTQSVSNFLLDNFIYSPQTNCMVYQKDLVIPASSTPHHSGTDQDYFPAQNKPNNPNDNLLSQTTLESMCKPNNKLIMVYIYLLLLFYSPNVVVYPSYYRSSTNITLLTIFTLSLYYNVPFFAVMKHHTTIFTEIYSMLLKQSQNHDKLHKIIKTVPEQSELHLMLHELSNLFLSSGLQLGHGTIFTSQYKKSMEKTLVTYTTTIITQFNYFYSQTYYNAFQTLLTVILHDSHSKQYYEKLTTTLNIFNNTIANTQTEIFVKQYYLILLDYYLKLETLILSYLSSYHQYITIIQSQQQNNTVGGPRHHYQSHDFNEDNDTSQQDSLSLTASQFQQFNALKLTFIQHYVTLQQQFEGVVINFYINHHYNNNHSDSYAIDTVYQHSTNSVHTPSAQSNVNTPACNINHNNSTLSTFSVHNSTNSLAKHTQKINITEVCTCHITSTYNVLSNNGNPHNQQQQTQQSNANTNANANSNPQPGQAQQTNQITAATSQAQQANFAAASQQALLNLNLYSNVFYNKKTILYEQHGFNMYNSNLFTQYLPNYLNYYTGNECNYNTAGVYNHNNVNLQQPTHVAPQDCINIYNPLENSFNSVYNINSNYTSSIFYPDLYVNHSENNELYDDQGNLITYTNNNNTFVNLHDENLNYFNILNLFRYTPQYINQNATDDGNGHIYHLINYSSIYHHDASQQTQNGLLVGPPTSTFVNRITASTNTVYQTLFIIQNKLKLHNHLSCPMAAHNINTNHSLIVSPGNGSPHLANLTHNFLNCKSAEKFNNIQQYQLLYLLSNNHYYTTHLDSFKNRGLLNYNAFYNIVNNNIINKYKSFVRYLELLILYNDLFYLYTYSVYNANNNQLLMYQTSMANSQRDVLKYSIVNYQQIIPLFNQPSQNGDSDASHIPNTNQPQFGIFQYLTNPQNNPNNSGNQNQPSQLPSHNATSSSTVSAGNTINSPNQIRYTNTFYYINYVLEQRYNNIVPSVSHQQSSANQRASAATTIATLNRGGIIQGQSAQASSSSIVPLSSSYYQHFHNNNITPNLPVIQQAFLQANVSSKPLRFSLDSFSLSDYYSVVYHHYSYLFNLLQKMKFHPNNTADPAGFVGLDYLIMNNNQFNLFLYTNYHNNNMNCGVINYNYYYDQNTNTDDESLSTEQPTKLETPLLLNYFNTFTTTLLGETVKYYHTQVPHDSRVNAQTSLFQNTLPAPVTGNSPTCNCATNTTVSLFFYNHQDTLVNYNNTVYDYYLYLIYTMLIDNIISIATTFDTQHFSDVRANSSSNKYTIFDALQSDMTYLYENYNRNGQIDLVLGEFAAEHSRKQRHAPTQCHLCNITVNNPTQYYLSPIHTNSNNNAFETNGVFHEILSSFQLESHPLYTNNFHYNIAINCYLLLLVLLHANNNSVFTSPSTQQVSSQDGKIPKSTNNYVNYYLLKYLLNKVLNNNSIIMASISNNVIITHIIFVILQHTYNNHTQTSYGKGVDNNSVITDLLLDFLNQQRVANNLQPASATTASTTLLSINPLNNLTNINYNHSLTVLLVLYIQAFSASSGLSTPSAIHSDDHKMNSPVLFLNSFPNKNGPGVTGQYLVMSSAVAPSSSSAQHQQILHISSPSTMFLDLKMTIIYHLIYQAGVKPIPRSRVIAQNNAPPSIEKLYNNILYSILLPHHKNSYLLGTIGGGDNGRYHDTPQNNTHNGMVMEQIERFMCYSSLICSNPNDTGQRIRIDPSSKKYLKLLYVNFSFMITQYYNHNITMNSINNSPRDLIAEQCNEHGSEDFHIFQRHTSNLDMNYHYHKIKTFFSTFLMTLYMKKNTSVFTLLFILLFKINNIQNIMLYEQLDNSFRTFLLYLNELNNVVYSLPQLNNTAVKLFNFNNEMLINGKNTKRGELYEFLSTPHFPYFIIYLTTLYEFFYSLLFLPTTTTNRFNPNDLLSLYTITTSYNIYNNKDCIKNKTNLAEIISYIKSKQPDGPGNKLNKRASIVAHKM